MNKCYYKEISDIDLLGEKWRPVTIFGRKLMASSFGRIKTTDTKILRKGAPNMVLAAKVKKQNINSTGRLIIQLTTNYKNNTIQVSRLVALAFIPNPENKPDVNHIDGDHLNNIPTNLEWVTRRENYNHAMKNGLMARGERQSCNKLTNIQVLEIFKSNISSPVLSKKYKVSVSTIRHIRIGRNWGWLTNKDKYNEQIINS